MAFLGGRLGLSQDVGPLVAAQLFGMVGDRQKIQPIVAGRAIGLLWSPLSIGVSGMAMQVAVVDTEAIRQRVGARGDGTALKGNDGGGWSPVGVGQLQPGLTVGATHLGAAGKTSHITDDARGRDAARRERAADCTGCRRRGRMSRRSYVLISVLALILKAGNWKQWLWLRKGR